MSESSDSPPPLPPPIPLLLLKSPSPTPPTDPYTAHLTTSSPSPYQPSTSTSNSTFTYTYTPHYIPLLTHTLLPDPLIALLLTHLQPHSQPFPYGALVFTSQRAVAAFTTALNAPPLQPHLPTLAELRINFYTVGPATERSLRGVRDRLMPLCGLYGGEGAGSGEVLAGIISGRGEGDGDGNGEVREGMYTTRIEAGEGVAGAMKPILFLTGEKRRDIIPRTLMEPSLPPEQRIQVDEMVVYKTGELQEFGFHFSRMLALTGGGGGRGGGVRWIVVFSPAAGAHVFGALGWLEAGTGQVRMGEMEGGRKTFVVCIGPTTKEYLEREFGFVADVVAEKPSPMGVREGIEKFMREKGI